MIDGDEFHKSTVQPGIRVRGSHEGGETALRSCPPRFTGSPPSSEQTDNAAQVQRASRRWLQPTLHVSLKAAAAVSVRPHLLG